MQVQQNNIISWHRSRACLLRSCCSTSHHKGYLVNNGNRTEWNPIFSVIIRVINKIGRPRSGSPICKSQVLPVYHNCYNFGKNTEIHLGHTSPVETTSKVKNSSILKIPLSFLLWLLWSILWLVNLAEWT